MTKTTDEPKLRRPRITQRTINGIITAAGFIMAGDTEATFSDMPPGREDDVIAADQWARKMRDWMQATGRWKERT